MYYCTCKSLWIEKASGGKQGVKPSALLCRWCIIDYILLKIQCILSIYKNLKILRINIRNIDDSFTSSFPEASFHQTIIFLLTERDSFLLSNRNSSFLTEYFDCYDSYYPHKKVPHG